MTTTLVTGANRGIGLELTRVLLAKGHEVIACCRTAGPALHATGARIETGIEVSNPRSIDELAARLQGTKIDWLINNAGILSMDSIAELDFEAIRQQFEVNALGPLHVTSKLLPRLGRGSRVILITSRMGSIADNGSGGAYGYRMSKAALNMAGSSLAKDLRSEGIAVGILHPGMVATDMTVRFGRNSSMQTPHDAAAQLVERIDELTMESSGSFRHANGEPLPW